MKCLYEILEVDEDCSSSDIKYAYKRLALKCHPDKNGDTVEAKEQFQSLQHAYNILNNPQERDFYDRNKDNLLQESASDGSQDVAKVICIHFPSSCFEGFDDSDEGFFTVYRLAFETIANKEREYMKKFHEIPSFGKSETDPKVVAGFYNYWLNYNTEMKFAWVDVHSVNHANNRQTERFMVRENKKMRDVARKKFVNYVRSFVQLVKKRDTRMKIYEKDRQKEIQRKQEETLLKQEDMRMRRIARKQELYRKATANATVDEAYEKKLRKLERHFDNECSDTSTDEEEEEETKSTENELYCVVCEKLFKTDNAFANHEKSKKHLDKLENLKEMMSIEDSAIFNTPSDKSEGSNTNSATFSMLSDEDLLDEEINKTKKKKRKSKQIPTDENSDSQCSPDEIKSQETSDIKPLDAVNNIKVRKSRRRNKNSEPKDENELLAEKIDMIKLVSANEDKFKKVKKPRRRNKKNDDVVQKEDKNNNCLVCGKEFPTKNKLFRHIEEEGHAALK